MSPLLMNTLLPLTLLAATAVPTDPARAEGPSCPRAEATAAAAPRAAEAPPPAEEAKPRRRKPEAW